MNQFVVLRLYPRLGGYSGVCVESVAKTREQAFGHAGQLAAKFSADNLGSRVVKAERMYTVFTADGEEVWYVVREGVTLDSSNYKLA